MQQKNHQHKAIRQPQTQADPDDSHMGEPDPAVERIRRRLVRLMMFSIMVTLLLVGAVFSVVIYRVMQPDTPQMRAGRPDGPENAYEHVYAATFLKPVDRKITLPEGTRLLSQSLSSGLVSLKTLRPDNSIELIIYDYRKGHIIARLQIYGGSDAGPKAADKTRR